MNYQGDIASQQTLYFLFTTNSSGSPTSLSGSASLSIYKDDGLVQSTAGITLTTDFDGITGLNNVKVITTDAFYAVGHDYAVVLSAGNVGGTSAIGYVVGSFSIENRHTKDSDGVTSILADYARRTGDYAAVGSAMTLSDDAITSAKFDETTAFPVKSADSGAVQIARTGADSDTLKTLSDQIDAVTTLGSGTITWIYNVKTVSGLNLSGVKVWITSDISGTSFIASGYTDINGNVTFYLDLGTIYVWSQKSGYNFVNPQEEVVV